MNKYNIYVMESINGIYTCKWLLLGTATARSRNHALNLVAPITEILDKPSYRRVLNKSFYEYLNCKYCVELIEMNTTLNHIRKEFK